MQLALFYPSIDIPNTAWLKTALLYWENLMTIVPESINNPYSTRTTQALQDEGFLRPLRVHSGMDEIKEMSSDVLNYLGSSESAALFLSSNGRGGSRIHMDKLPPQFERGTSIHADKLSHEVQQAFNDYYKQYQCKSGSDVREPFSRPRRRDNGPRWLEVNENFANFYMTLLANRLALRMGAGLLTDIPSADNLAMAARLDARLAGAIPKEIEKRKPGWYTDSSFTQRTCLPKELGSGLLANLAIERIAISPETPISEILSFKARHRDELALFRSKIDMIASSIDQDLPIEALRQKISDLYEEEVKPATNSLKMALEGRRIKWLNEGLLKISFMSVGSTALVAAGLTVPAAIIAGAGLSLIASKINYNIDREEALRSNPYSYLLSVRNEFKPK